MDYIFDKLLEKKDNYSTMIISAINQTLDHFDIQENRNLVAQSFLNMSKVDDAKIDRSDDRMQVLAMMYSYFIKMIPEK